MRVVWKRVMPKAWLDYVNKVQEKNDIRRRIEDVWILTSQKRLGNNMVSTDYPERNSVNGAGIVVTN